MERCPTIILADDDPGFLAQTSAALNDAGFKVIQASDGQKALQEVLNQRVDLIIMDISMPEVDGLEAVHCLKAMPKTCKIPLILTVSRKDQMTRMLGEHTHGSARVLRKPFNPEELISLAQGLVKSKPRIGAAARLTRRMGA